MGLPHPASLSPSAISAFKQCPLAFRFAYVERLPEPPSPWASKGTLVHRALQLLLCRPAASRTRDAALADLALASAELADHPDLVGLELSASEWAEFHTDAQRLVLRYFDLEDPATVHPIGLELKLEARIGAVRLRGVIDRLELDRDGELVVTDYKTGAVPSEQWEARSLSGVHLYALLCERMLGRRPARVQLLYLSTPEAIVAKPTGQSIVGAEHRTAAIWAAIEHAAATGEFRPNPSRLCDFCSFRPYCPAFGGDPAEAALLCGPGAVVEPALPLLLGT